MKYLLATTEVYRVETVEEVEALHEELKKDTMFSLLSFGYKTKEIKEKGEVVETYQLITVKKCFNEEKFPTDEININYEVNF